MNRSPANCPWGKWVRIKASITSLIHSAPWFESNYQSNVPLSNHSGRGHRLRTKIQGAMNFLYPDPEATAHFDDGCGYLWIDLNRLTFRCSFRDGEDGGIERVLRVGLSWLESDDSLQRLTIDDDSWMVFVLSGGVSTRRLNIKICPWKDCYEEGYLHTDFWW